MTALDHRAEPVTASRAWILQVLRAAAAAAVSTRWHARVVERVRRVQLDLETLAPSDPGKAGLADELVRLDEACAEAARVARVSKAVYQELVAREAGTSRPRAGTRGRITRTTEATGAHHGQQTR
jgi:hypothetical protein